MGGLGARLTELRSCNAPIGSRGKAKGVRPLVNEINAKIRYANQGGVRAGVCNVQLDITHPEILGFVGMRSTAASTASVMYDRCHDLDNTLLLNWWFMDALKAYLNGDTYRKISLFCPYHTPKLHQLRGEDWIKEYKICLADDTIPRTQVLISDILKTCNKITRESGHPYLVNIDAANAKSNQHMTVLGAHGPKTNYILQTNLCLEIYEVNDDSKIFSCNLSQVSLKQYAHGTKGSWSSRFDFPTMASDVRAMVRAHNQLLNHNVSPLETLDYVHTPEVDGDGPRTTKGSAPFDIREYNIQTAPLGMGWSGYDDACKKMHVKSMGKNGLQFAQLFSACYYYNAILESINESIKYGRYKDFESSSLAKGKFQFDLWRDETETLKGLGMLTEDDIKYFRHPEWDVPPDPTSWKQAPYTLCNGVVVGPSWDELRSAAMKFGLRNQLLLASMPSATTSQALSNTQASEIPLANFCTRLTDYGAFTRISAHLELELSELGLWSEPVIQFLMANEGSLLNLGRMLKDFRKHQITEGLPDPLPNLTPSVLKKLKSLHKRFPTAYEVPTEDRMAYEAIIGRFVCQGSSFNWYERGASDDRLNQLLLRGMLMGLKTVRYYFRQPDVIPPSKSSIISIDVLDIVEKYRGKEYRKAWEAAQNEEVKPEFDPTVSSAPEMIESELRARLDLTQVPAPAPVCLRGEGGDCEGCG